MEPPPPPPPPHGNNAQPGSKSGGLPDGKYDIFVIPPSSAGSGFLYLPSLSTQRNSFLAGVVCTSAAFFIYQTAVPVVKEWFSTTVNGGGSSVFMLILGVGVVSWAFGKTQGEGTQWTSSGSTPRPDGGTSYARSQSTGNEYAGPPPQASTSSPPPHPPPQPEGPPPQASPPPPKSSWQRPQASAKATADAKSSWEKAREETRKREQERRNAEEIKRRKEELEKERLRQREKEARERLERELKEKREREDREKREKETKEKLEKLEAEKKERDARERIIQEAKEREDKLKKELEDAKAKATAAAANAKKPPVPTAATEKDDDAYSFRPYDRPKRAAQTNSAGSIYSEDSYAPSATTAKTTPPPSVRGPYTTKDPDKIIIKAVYSFNNAFLRTPIAQLVSGQGHVTDGLILRITTEGLFIDDDVRGVPQREWDVKAWTLKLAEVWCPGIPTTNKAPMRDKSPFSYLAASRRVKSSSDPDSSAVFVDTFTAHCLSVCSEAYKEACKQRSIPVRLRRFSSAVTTVTTDTNDTTSQSCEVNGQHVLRASIRDQEGKRYVFVIAQSEGWKVAVGLQRLRKGTQVRALGVAGMPQNEAKALLDNLGWS